ncbi:MAG: S16 family serine protease, partial [Thalassolituus sp.]
IQRPIDQSFAITGSVNQYGEAQAIGGVNEKIEGFFRICAARGLTGKQGVIIPASNQRNLVLHDDVLRAIESGMFHVYCVRHVDEALRLLLNSEPGVADNKGNFPSGTTNAAIIKRLEQIAKLGESKLGD